MADKIKPSRRAVAQMVAAAFLVAGMPGEAEAFLFKKGGGGAALAIADITTFSIQNFASAATSKGVLQFGCPFKKGDVASGRSPAIANVTTGALYPNYQFDQRSYWSDGSLKFAVATIFDTTFTASEERNYKLVSVKGVLPTTAGAYTLADFVSGTDYKVALTNVKDSAGAAIGSGSFTMSLNADYATTTRVTQLAGGRSRLSWVVWGMATDNTGGLPDTHLKYNAYCDLILNPDGTINDRVIMFELALDWWNQPVGWTAQAKSRMTYDAVFKDGSTSLYTYSTVNHPYQARWGTVRTDNDDNHARRYWAAAIPTLLYKPNKSYWVSTGLITPWDTTYTPSSNATVGNTASYIPLNNENQRAFIDATGAYQGRGLLTNVDCIDFMRQTSNDRRYARTNWWAGPHVPYHYRSGATRTRPGESADVANTVISMIMRPLSAGAYDFTSVGMPAAIDAYTQSSSAPVSSTYGTAPTGQTVGGAAGVWTTSIGASHAVNYCGMGYLLEGERFWLEALLDLATNCAHQMHGNSLGGAPKAMYSGVTPFQALLSIPATQYSGIGCGPPNQNPRNVGWSAGIIAHAAALVPTVDVQNLFIQLYFTQAMAYVKFNMTYMPADQLASGVLQNIGTIAQQGSTGVFSPWMMSFNAMGLWFAYSCCESADALWALNNCLNNHVTGLWDGGWNYRSNDYRAAVLTYTDTAYDPATNPCLAANARRTIEDCTVLTGVDTLNFATVPNGTVGPTNGDVFYMSGLNSSPAACYIPPSMSAGTPYYAVQTSGLTCKLSATLGGAPLTLNASGSTQVITPMGLNMALQSLTVAVNPPYLPAGDSFTNISVATTVMLYNSGITGVTVGIANQALAFAANTNDASWPNWRMRKLA